MMTSIQARIENLAQSNKRSTELIATFTNGYADDWYMAVKESFRSQLDIRYTDRVEKVIDDSGESLNLKNKIWTQGPRIFFDKGYIFYNTSLGYQEWYKALENLELVCVVLEGKSNDLIRKKNGNEGKNNANLVDGYVIIELLKPDKAKKQLFTYKKFKRTQNEFVDFLITGDYSQWTPICTDADS